MQGLPTECVRFSVEGSGFKVTEILNGFLQKGFQRALGHRVRGEQVYGYVSWVVFC